MDPELAERLNRLETHIAHLEKQYEELNEVMIEQGRALRKLQAAQQRIAETIETAELDRIQSTRVRPPHSR
ncbi:MAG TPA: SlyX family protein [Methylomirabilota bacterium]|nr:SlyX family protein [Methylomirabilota bacterium]